MPSRGRCLVDLDTFQPANTQKRYGRRNTFNKGQPAMTKAEADAMAKANAPAVDSKGRVIKTIAQLKAASPGDRNYYLTDILNGDLDKLEGARFVIAPDLSDSDKEYIKTELERLKKTHQELVKTAKEREIAAIKYEEWVKSSLKIDARKQTEDLIQFYNDNIKLLFGYSAGIKRVSPEFCHKQQLLFTHSLRLKRLIEYCKDKIELVDKKRELEEAYEVFKANCQSIC